MVPRHGRIVGNAVAGCDARARTPRGSESAHTVDQLSFSLATGICDHSRTRIQNQARGRHSASVPCLGRSHSVGRAALCATGARDMVGTAPPNHLERILARHLDGAHDMDP